MCAAAYISPGKSDNKILGSIRSRRHGKLHKQMTQIFIVPLLPQTSIWLHGEFFMKNCLVRW